MHTQEKILSLPALAKICALEKAKGKKIIHCHGVFDLLHPGHLKYFSEAKTLGDVLVVTLTNDLNVNKGPGRPVYTQTQRAEFLASLSLIDYVAINDTATAVKPIELLKPDYYVKGQDYEDKSKDKSGGIYLEEKAVLDVGGKLYFTHGETFSSTQLLKLLDEKKSTESLPTELLLKLYFEMLRIRRIEEAIAREYPKQEMRCPIHLSIGQEAPSVAVSSLLTTEDHIFSTHRCHAHYLSKGGSLERMLAELFGKGTGCNGGKGGSMHLVDPEVGMMGASALVGGTIPIGVGSALAFKKAGIKNIAVVYLGDGATEEGVFYESLNFAALHKLPVLFLVENNTYATYSPQSARQATSEIYKRGEPFQIPGIRVAGNSVQEIYLAAKKLITRMRSGEGPAILECLTYRFRDHVGPGSDIAVGYRTQEELNTWQEKCPLLTLKAELARSNSINEEMDSDYEQAIRFELERAFEFARSSHNPKPSEVKKYTYASPQV